MKYRYDNRTEYDLREACDKYGFLLPPYFDAWTNSQFLEVWNGIGAAGDWGNIFIPETVYFLNISLASLPHDIMFVVETSLRGYHLANLYFLYNMNQIVTKESDNGFTKNLRMLRTNKYYMGTESTKGLIAFNNKNII